MPITSDDFKKQPKMKKKLPKMITPSSEMVRKGRRATERMGMGKTIEMGRPMIKNPTEAMTGKEQPRMMNEVTLSEKKVTKKKY